MRKTKVSYSPQELNDFLGITPPQNSELDRTNVGYSGEELDTIFQRLATEGAEWTFKGRARLLRTQFMNPEANMWFYFMRHTLHPTSHDTNLCLEKVFILYCILECKHFDVGRLICGNIRTCVDRSNGRLLYPSIIHKLLEQAHVRVLPTDTFIMEKTVMDKKNLVRLMKINNNPSPSTTMEAL